MTTKNPKFLKIPLTVTNPTLGGFFSADWFPLNIIIVCALAGVGFLIWLLVKPKHKIKCKPGQYQCINSDGILTQCCNEWGECCNGVCDMIPGEEKCINEKPCPVDQISHPTGKSGEQMCCDQGVNILPIPTGGCGQCPKTALCDTTKKPGGECILPPVPSPSGSTMQPTWPPWWPSKPKKCTTKKDCRFTFCPKGTGTGKGKCCQVPNCIDEKCCTSENICTDGDDAICCDSDESCCLTNHGPKCCSANTKWPECCNKGTGTCDDPCVSIESLKPSISPDGHKFTTTCNPSWKTCSPGELCDHDISSNTSSCLPLPGCDILPLPTIPEDGWVYPANKIPGLASKPGKDLLPLYACTEPTRTSVDQGCSNPSDPYGYLYGTGYGAGTVLKNLWSGGRFGGNYGLFQNFKSDITPREQCRELGKECTTSNCCDCAEEGAKRCAELVGRGLGAGNKYNKIGGSGPGEDTSINCTTRYPGAVCCPPAAPGVPRASCSTVSEVEQCLSNNVAAVKSGSPMPCEISQLCSAMLEPCCAKGDCSPKAKDICDADPASDVTSLNFWNTYMPIPPRSADADGKLAIFSPRSNDGQPKSIEYYNNASTGCPADKLTFDKRINALYPHQACSNWTTAPRTGTGGGYVNSSQDLWNGLVCTEGASGDDHPFCGWDTYGLPTCYKGFECDSMTGDFAIPYKEPAPDTHVTPIGNPGNPINKNLLCYNIDPVEKAFKAQNTWCKTNKCTTTGNDGDDGCLNSSCQKDDSICIKAGCAWTGDAVSDPTRNRQKWCIREGDGAVSAAEKRCIDNSGTNGRAFCGHDWVCCGGLDPGGDDSHCWGGSNASGVCKTAAPLCQNEGDMPLLADLRKLHIFVYCPLIVPSASGGASIYKCCNPAYFSKGNDMTGQLPHTSFPGAAQNCKQTLNDPRPTSLCAVQKQNDDLGYGAFAGNSSEDESPTVQATKLYVNFQATGEGNHYEKYTLYSGVEGDCGKTTGDKTHCNGGDSSAENTISNDDSRRYGCCNICTGNGRTGINKVWTIGGDERAPSAGGKGRCAGHVPAASAPYFYVEIWQSKATAVQCLKWIDKCYKPVTVYLLNPDENFAIAACSMGNVGSSSDDDGTGYVCEGGSGPTGRELRAAAQLLVLDSKAKLPYCKSIGDDYLVTGVACGAGTDDDDSMGGEIDYTANYLFAWANLDYCSTLSDNTYGEQWVLNAKPAGGGICGPCPAGPSGPACDRGAPCTRAVIAGKGVPSCNGPAGTAGDYCIETILDTNGGSVPGAVYSKRKEFFCEAL